MVTICNLSVPAREVGLAATLQTVPDARVACEPVVASGQSECLPLLRARSPDRQLLETAFTSDASVAEWTRLTGRASDWLYRIVWAADVSLVHQLLVGERALVLAATASGDEWSLRVLYQSRQACSQSHTFWEKRNLSVTIDAIRELDAEQSTHHGLTEAQYTALVVAYEQGYFAVPREDDLKEVAEELDISHQALSERLRRAHETLITATLD